MRTSGDPKCGTALGRMERLPASARSARASRQARLQSSAEHGGRRGDAAGYTRTMRRFCYRWRTPRRRLCYNGPKPAMESHEVKAVSKKASASPKTWPSPAAATRVRRFLRVPLTAWTSRSGPTSARQTAPSAWPLLEKKAPSHPSHGPARNPQNGFS